MPDPKQPTPSDRAPTQSAPFEMPSPFPAPEAPAKPSSARRKALWGVLGVVLVAAAKWFLTSQGVPVPLVDEAARQLQHALPQQ